MIFFLSLRLSSTGGETPESRPVCLIGLSRGPLEAQERKTGTQCLVLQGSFKGVKCTEGRDSIIEEL